MTYDIENLIEKYKDKNHIDIIMGLTTEVTQLDAIHRAEQKGASAYQFNQYRKYAGDLLFFLNTGVTPATIGIEGLQKFLPIIKNLVEKGQLKKDVLEKFKA